MSVNGSIGSWSWRYVGICLIGFLSFSLKGQAQQPPQRLHHHVPQLVANGKAPLVGKLAPSKSMQLTVVLPLRNQVELTSLLSELYDPASPLYRHFLTIPQFTDEFSPTAQDYQTVITYFQKNGFTIRDTSDNRLILDISGTVAQVNAVFGVSMNVYQDPNRKRTFFSPDREPTLSLGVSVAHVEGLNDFSVPQPMFHVKKNAAPVANVTGSGPGGYYTGSDMRAAYYGGSLLTGAGQSVGLFEFGGYRLSDVNLTFSNAGQSYNVPINNVLIDGASAAAGSDDAEQVLDIAQAIGMAPGLSQVRVYIGTTSDADIFNKMATDKDSQGHPICKELSVSWSWIPDDPTTDDPIFEEFAAQGQSLFVASGDDGAYDPSVSPYFYPAEDANVTAVGATNLATNYGGGPWVSESAWNTSGYGSGGGVSPDGIPLPGWQQGAVTWPSGGSNSLRNVPDVAMEGDNDNYYCDLGTCSGGAGGTSFAAPRWAGFMALINQQAEEVGSAPSGGLGFINPSIYSIGEGSNYIADFHDVTDGNNDTANQIVWYNAVTGYDLVTGWGSPNGQNLIDALAGTIVPGFWLTTAPSTLSVYQGDSGTAVVSVTDAGGFAGNVNLTASNLPTGVTASFNPTSTPGTSELVLTVDSTATVGTQTINITGTSGALTAANQLFLTVNPPQTPPPPGGQFGSVNIGATSNATPLTLTIKTAGTLSNIGVLTQGSPNLDFADAGGDTCSIGTAYTVNATCTVNVKFTPKYPGTRYGAVVLIVANGIRLAEAYLQGSGTGPQTTFNPGLETTIGTGFLSPEGVAIMADGSLYVADYGNSTTHGAVYLETLANGSYTQTQLNCTYDTPAAVAVDGSGTLYVADPGVSAVYKVTISNGNCTQTAIGSGFSQPWGVAVDGSGDIYIAAKGNGAVYKETLQSNGSYLQSSVGSGWIKPVGVAVDGAGNIYIADSGIPGVFMETPSGGNYTQTPIGQGWIAPSGITVDGTGNIYVSEAGNSMYYGGSVPAGIYKEVLASGTYIQTPISAGWTAPYGLAVDATGNVEAADALRGVYKEDLADPPQLAFANAPSGTTSSDSPRIVTVSNLGTAALNFSAVSYPTDFPEAGANSSDCTPTTSLQAGQACTLTIEFLPTTSLGGNTSLLLNEAVSVSTNTLNTTATQQSIPVSGTELLPGGSVNLDVSANPSTAGSSIVLTATVSGSSGGPPPTGTVTFYNGATPLGPAVSLVNAVATYSTASLAAGTYAISAAYSGDSNYASSTSNTINESILAAAGTAPISSTNLGSLNIGSTSSPIPLTITFAQTETLGGIAVLTGGAPNLDFTNSGGGSCTVGTAYNANDNCTVSVAFSPKYPGVRNGAVVLSDNSGNVIGTGYLQGTGVGAQTAFPPGTIASINSNGTPLAYPQGVAVDRAGALYVTDAANATVYKETANPFYGGYDLAAIGSGFTVPYGVAVDAAGNLYVADSGNHAVYKETPSNGSYTQTVIGYGFSAPMGVAVDGFGNVYVADHGNGANPGVVYLEILSDGSYAQTKITGTFDTPQGIAVDGNGDVFVADSANGSNTAAVYELTPANGPYNQSSIGYGWVTPTGVAVDGNGNVFVTDDAYDIGDGFVAEETPQPGGTYAQSIIADDTSIPDPGGIALDDRGNRYITDNLEGIQYLQDIADPSASFAATNYGQTSSDSPKTITLENVGNTALTFSSLSYPIDFPETPGVLTDCTETSSLQIGSSCTLTVNFIPSAPLTGNQSQPFAENATVTTNSLGGSTQNVAVSGTEAAPAATVTLTAPSNVFIAGANVTFTATVTGQDGLPAPTGTVTFNATTYGGTTTLGTTPLTNGIATYSTSSLTVGAYSVTATYSGDQIYPTSTSPAFVENIIPSSTFGTESIGNSESSTITVTFSSHITLGSITVLTEGMPNLDFTNAGTGTCKIGNRYSSKSSCTVAISFKPTFAGARHGALLIGDNTGTLVQTIYLDGNGVGPQVSFQPATETTIIPETSAPCAQEVDASGDIYINTCGAIMKYTLNNGTYTPSQIPSSALGDIAVDGAGNVYIAGGGEVLKETLLQGTYSESVIATGLYAPRDIAVDGKGVVYFIVGYGSQQPTYAQLYEETPASSGGYTQTIADLQNVYDPIKLAVDDSGDIFLNDYQLWCNLSCSSTYFIEILDEYPLGVIGFVPNFLIWGNNNEIVKLAFVDPRGNLYATVDNQFVELPPITGAPPYLPMPTDGWGMDGSGNLYRNVDNGITRVNLASPPNLRFAQTNVGSTSSDSPKVATLENFGNAPLTFSVPGSGTNPSVSTNFALDSSSTCPQISASGSPSSLGMESSCTYAVNFTPTTTGTINGSAIVSDDALNAPGGTQTVPLSGDATSEAQLALLTTGPNGAVQLRWLPKGELVQNPVGIGEKHWIENGVPTFIIGAAWFQTGTCTEIGPGSFTVASDPMSGVTTGGHESIYLPDGQCPGQLYDFVTASYTWRSGQSGLQAPFALAYYTPSSQYEGTAQFNAEMAHITLSPTTPYGTVSNPSLMTTATLMNPPISATGYNWTIIGGGGAIVFPNGLQTMSSTTNSITVEEPHLSGGDVSFSLSVTVKTAGPTLTYGPVNDTFHDIGILSIDPNVIMVGSDSVQVTINGFGFGSSPSVNLPAGVTSSGQTSTDSQIVISLSVGDNATVGNTTISVTANGMTSNAEKITLDGPYTMEVTNDQSGPCDTCRTTIQRTVSYQVKNFSGSNSGDITVCELPTASNWTCQENRPSIITGRICGQNYFDAYSGQFDDQWSLGSDNWTPKPGQTSCGFQKIRDPWYWSYTSPRTLIGTPSGFVYTTAIQIDGKTTPDQLTKGTIMPK